MGFVWVHVGSFLHRVASPFHSFVPLMQVVFTTIDSSAYAHLARAGNTFTVRTKVHTSFTKTDMPCLLKLSITTSQICIDGRIHDTMYIYRLRSGLELGSPRCDLFRQARLRMRTAALRHAVVAGSAANH